MKKKNILKENKEYSRIINNEKPIKTKLYNIYLDKENYQTYEFGFSVGKKIGNAVTRNKIRRQLKSIIDKKNYLNNFKCIIMVKKPILNSTYQEMEDEMLKVIDTLNILKQNENK